MVEWHHQLNGHEFEQAQGYSEGQGRLACCSPWGHKELDSTEQLNNNLILTSCLPLVQEITIETSLLTKLQVVSDFFLNTLYFIAKWSRRYEDFPYPLHLNRHSLPGYQVVYL